MGIDEVRDVIKKSLKGVKSQYANEYLEKTLDGWNLTFVFYSSTLANNYVAFTKFSFLLDKTKKELRDNKVLILMDLLCNYAVGDFENPDKLGEILKSLFEKGYDKGDIKELGDFIVNGPEPFNKILNKERISNYIYSLELIPDTKLTTCQETKFNFNVKDNNNEHAFSISKPEAVKWEIEIEGSKSDLSDLAKELPQFLISKWYSGNI